MINKDPEILAVNGKTGVVVQDAETYERISALDEYAESIQSRQALSEK